MTESDYLNELIKQANEAVDLFASHRKSEREALVCKAFLRCLGVNFSNDEIYTPDSDPPDVIFRGSKFEVMMATDKQTLHGDWKAEAVRRKSAQRLIDLAEPYEHSEAMDLRATYDFVSAKLARKANHYGYETCSTLDALVYLNMKKRHLWPIEISAIPIKLRDQGWRSVSFVFVPYSHVVFAGTDAPKYLKENQGAIRQECADPGKYFAEWIARSNKSK